MNIFTCFWADSTLTLKAVLVNIRKLFTSKAVHTVLQRMCTLVHVWLEFKHNYIKRNTSSMVHKMCLQFLACSFSAVSFFRAWVLLSVSKLINGLFNCTSFTRVYYGCLKCHDNTLQTVDRTRSGPDIFGVKPSLSLFLPFYRPTQSPSENWSICRHLKAPILHPGRKEHRVRDNVAQD